MSTSKDKGGAADLKAQRAAAVTAVEFQTNEAADLLRDMATANSDSNTAKQDKDEASVKFCIFAAEMVTNELTREGGCRDRAVVSDGFCKHMDTLRPMLAAEGSILVDVKTEDGKDTRYSWKGHGANVKTIARGVTEFHGLENTEGQPMIVDPSTAESFTEIKKSVQVARQSDEDDATRELREAKEGYRELESIIRGIALGQKTAAEVNAVAEDMQDLLDDWLQLGEDQAQRDEDAEALAELDAELDVIDESIEAIESEVA